MVRQMFFTFDRRQKNITLTKNELVFSTCYVKRGPLVMVPRTPHLFWMLEINWIILG